MKNYIFCQEIKYVTKLLYINISSYSCFVISVVIIYTKITVYSEFIWLFNIIILSFSPVLLPLPHTSYIISEICLDFLWVFDVNSILYIVLIFGMFKFRKSFSFYLFCTNFRTYQFLPHSLRLSYLRLQSYLHPKKCIIFLYNYLILFV